jgi:hypothetical protein
MTEPLDVEAEGLLDGSTTRDPAKLKKRPEDAKG